MLNVQLVIIDPQNDFCYPGFVEWAKVLGLSSDPIIPSYCPPEWIQQGSLYVPGAFEDMIRMANMIERVGDKISDIHVTMDTHHYLDIAHPSYWVSGSDGVTHPDPFTIITVSDVENGVWRCKVPQWQKRALKYVKALKDNNKYDLCIWPYHTRIGTFGFGIVEPLINVLTNWEAKHGWIDYVTKGSNMHTEHYSGLCADVPDPKDSTTGINKELIKTTAEADIIAFGGEALSHCLANTFRDFVSEFGTDHVKKMVILEDASSNVPGFDDLGTEFINEMRGLGVKISNTNNFLR